jgi:hypothetical protein
MILKRSDALDEDDQDGVTDEGGKDEEKGNA